MKKKDVVQVAVNLGQFPSLVHRYHKFDENLVDSIKECYLWFSDPTAFNDPFDCNIVIEAEGKIGDYEKWLRESPVFNGTEEEIKNKARELKLDPNLVTRINLQTKNIISKYGICCFSLSNVNIQMWSYYTGGHEGVCLTYDLAEIINEDMTPIKVVYQPNYPSYNHLTKKGEHDLTVSIMGVKSHQWQHEKEFRIVSLKQGRNDIPRAALKSIIFGCKMHTKAKNRILEILRSSYNTEHVIIGEAELLDRKYGLTIKWKRDSSQHRL